MKGPQIKKNYENDNSINEDSVILLKGRKKKIPNSINYNELFANKLKDKSINTISNLQSDRFFEDKNLSYFENNTTINTVEDFFYKVKQQKQVIGNLNEYNQKNIVDPIQINT